MTAVSVRSQDRRVSHHGEEQTSESKGRLWTRQPQFGRPVPRADSFVSSKLHSLSLVIRRMSCIHCEPMTGLTTFCRSCEHPETNSRVVLSQTVLVSKPQIRKIGALSVQARRMAFRGFSGFVVNPGFQTPQDLASTK